MVVGISMKVVLAAVGIGIAALFLAFACSRLLYTHIHRRRSFVSLPSAPSPSSVASAAVHLDGTHGLHPAAVAAFPTRAFSPLSPDPTQCVVCLAEYEEKDVLRFLPYCGHNFHVACIDLWLRQHATCPVCRILLYNYPDETCTTPSIPYALTRPLYSLQAIGLDPCHGLFAGTGQSTRTSPVLGNEPDQANQIICGPSARTMNSFALPEANCSNEMTTNVKQ